MPTSAVVKNLLAAATLMAGVLAFIRLLFEALFPHASWLGLPTVALPLATTLAFTLWYSWQAHATALAPIMPLLLNLRWVLATEVDLVRASLYFAASVWLLMLLAWQRRPAQRLWHANLLLLAAVLPVYVATVGRTVGAADTFEFQVTAPRLGIAHPTGYPLYLLLGKLWTLLLPLANPALRLNVGTMIYGLVALLLLLRILHSLTGSLPIAVLGTALFATRPTFWSQAIEAEVYTLHLLLLAAILLLALRLRQRLTPTVPAVAIILFLTGISLTNHLTTVLLLPAVALAVLLFADWRALLNPRRIVVLLAVLLLPLLLYLYLPLRWLAVNNEPMGIGRFFSWVSGSRFQGALQWRAWLDDPTRYSVVGRLFNSEWGWLPIAVILIGAVLLWQRHWRTALILTIGWLAFTFYALNYYVPDLNVFLLPAQLIMTLFWATTAARLLERFPVPAATAALVIALMLPALVTLPQSWRRVDASTPDELVDWARATLAQPLAQNAAILADSDKFPPLFYLQQAEQIRTDLDIVVLPDEAAYRAAIQERLAQNQTVYLARFLPGLPYPLRSAGPLVELLPQRLTVNDSCAGCLLFADDAVALKSVTVDPNSDYAKDVVALELEWQLLQATAQPQQLYSRWRLDNDALLPSSGRHPVANSYATNGWQVGEVVTDFYLIERPLPPQPVAAALQLALAPPFTPAARLQWQTVATFELQPVDLELAGQTVRVWNRSNYVFAVDYPRSARPAATLSSAIRALTTQPPSVAVTLHLHAVNAAATQPRDRLTWVQQLQATADDSRWHITAHAPLHCGWLQPARSACPLDRLQISGVALPSTATNFGDKIALLAVDLPQRQLTPGGLFDLSLNWLALQKIEEDYTVFVQVVDAADRIVGQVDSWPLQGTFPTSQWQAGTRVRDPYQLQLSEQMPAGEYKLLIGLYRLRDLQRLPVLDQSGRPIDDKFTQIDLYVAD